MTRARISPWQRFRDAFGRAFSAFANSGLIRFVSWNHATPALDLTLCTERLAHDDPDELVIALRWLRSMQSPATARASGRVAKLLQHADPTVRSEAGRTRDEMRSRFGESSFRA